VINYVKLITSSGLYMDNGLNMFQYINKLYESNRHLRS